MNTEYFKNQVDRGHQIFFYGIEQPVDEYGNIQIDLKSFKGELETFPSTLQFVRMMANNTPLFKETK
jgi:hypothetical protein